ncbi:MAG TPA: hypothetical protein VFX49_09205, partial [Chloroflexota bacterium]|nr:hypothetical protein [Chloroflexota bacterium]
MEGATAHAAGRDGGYAVEAQPWLPLDGGARVEDAAGFAIGGSIWVTRDHGGVLRSFGGRPEPFQQ